MFAPNTLILTNNGWHAIKTLPGMTVGIWNGSEWSDATVRLVDRSQPMYRVDLSDGSYIECTKHQGMVVKYEYTPRMVCDLKVGDELEQSPLYPVMLSHASPMDPRYQYEQTRPDHVPFEFRIFTRLLWLSNRFDKDAGYMQITHSDKNWLRQVKLLAQGLGVMPYIVETCRGYHLRFSSEDARVLLDDLLMPINKNISDYKFNCRPSLTVVGINELEQPENAYQLVEPKKRCAIFNGVYAVTH